VRGPWETARAADEVLESVKLACWPDGTHAAYVKFGVHERPTLAVAVALRPETTGGAVAEARIAAGCVGPRPIRMTGAEARLTGAPIADLETRAREAADIAAAAADPADDLYGSADYKREMVAVFVRRAIRIAASRARGVEPTERFPHAVVA
jgi:carbon-monoxide dehydrogenase medium subunit